MKILTDFEYAQIICKEIKKINSKKTYNIESLNKDEKSKLISVLKTKLQLNDSQCLFLVDNYYHTKDLAKKLGFFKIMAYSKKKRCFLKF